MIALYIKIHIYKELEDLKINNMKDLIEKYNSSYKYKEIGEVLTLIQSKTAVEYFLFGSIKLPYDFNRSSDEMLEIQLDALEYWLQCLTALYRLGWEDVWEVTLDDIPLKWDTIIGWTFD